MVTHLTVTDIPFLARTEEIGPISTPVEKSQESHLTMLLDEKDVIEEAETKVVRGRRPGRPKASEAAETK